MSKNKQIAIIVSSAVAIILLIVAIVILVIKGSDDEVDVLPSIEPTQNLVTINREEVEMMERAIKNSSDSDIEVISNISNYQADIILESIGIEITDLEYYAASIDIRDGTAHAILIIKPIEETRKQIRQEIVNFIGNKQTYFVLTENTDSEEYKVAKETYLIDYDKYIVVVMDSNPYEKASAIIDEISNYISNTELQESKESQEIEDVAD